MMSALARLWAGAEARSGRQAKPAEHWVNQQGVYQVLANGRHAEQNVRQQL